MGVVSNPYKLLFSLGVLFGTLGVLIWWFFNQGWISFYPRQAHFQIMFFAFFWCFVAGFLMTAIPRMTSTHLSNPIEVSLVALLTTSQVILNFFNLTRFSTILYIFQMGLLIVFILKRFLKFRKLPFDGFLFMPAAFLSAFVGLFLFLKLGDEKSLILFSGEGFLLNLIIGLGSKLVPAISRLPNAVMGPGVSFHPNYRRVVIKVLLLNSSFFLEYFGSIFSGNLLRTVVILYIAIVDFGLFKKGTVFSFVGAGLKSAAVFLVFGHLMRTFGLEVVPSSHLIYIGGFSLLTLMIATRVTLAHSEFSLDYELSSKRVVIITVLLCMASVFRWVSGYTFAGPVFWISIILYSLALLIWLDKHSKLIWRGSSQSSH
ncbi:MAG: NnrS family protein [Bdellovibrionales bacterium]|nr:NnrS family protein [Bdellovibrionales bacterium]